MLSLWLFNAYLKNGGHSDKGLEFLELPLDSFLNGQVKVEEKTTDRDGKTHVFLFLCYKKPAQTPHTGQHKKAGNNADRHAHHDHKHHEEPNAMTTATTQEGSENTSLPSLLRSSSSLSSRPVLSSNRYCLHPIVLSNNGCLLYSSISLEEILRKSNRPPSSSNSTLTTGDMGMGGAGVNDEKEQKEQKTYFDLLKHLALPRIQKAKKRRGRPKGSGKAKSKKFGPREGKHGSKSHSSSANSTNNLLTADSVPSAQLAQCCDYCNSPDPGANRVKYIGVKAYLKDKPTEYV